MDALDDRKGRMDLYSGFGDTLARGVEFAMTPALFAGFGYVLDRVFGLVPILTIVMFAVGAFGIGVRTYYQYEAKMQALDAQGPWAARRAAADGDADAR